MNCSAILILHNSKVILILLNGFIKKTQKTHQVILSWQKAVSTREKVMSKNPHIGPDLDSFLEDEGILASSQIKAIKKVRAYLLQDKIDYKNRTS